MYLNEVLEFIVVDHLKVHDKVYVERLTERAEFLSTTPPANSGFTSLAGISGK
jgi:hypothetical protein